MHFDLSDMNIPLLKSLLNFEVSIFPTVQQADVVVLSVFIVDLNSFSDYLLIVFTSPLDSLIFHLHLLLSLALLILVVFFFKILLQSVGDVHLVALSEPLHFLVLLAPALKHGLAI